MEGSGGLLGASPAPASACGLRAEVSTAVRRRKPEAVIATPPDEEAQAADYGKGPMVGDSKAKPHELEVADLADTSGIFFVARPKGPPIARIWLPRYLLQA